MSLVTVAPVAASPPRATGRFFVDLAAYGLVSAMALATDYAGLLGLTALGLHYLLASLLSFTAGMGVAYALSARFVFADRRAASRDRELLGFVAIGLLGLALTQILLALLVGGVGLPVAAAKIPTTGLVFLFNFIGRRSLVFVGRGTT